MGIRVIKTAIATMLAVIAADLAGLQSPLSAGLLAILGVEVTRRRSVRTIVARFTGSLLGLFLASLLFKLLGFDIWVLALYILVAFPLLARANLKDGIITSSVVVFHIFGKQEVSMLAIGNELASLAVGFGAATAVNLIYMPKVDERLSTVRNQAEQLFSAIFVQIANHLRDGNYIWSGRELLEAQEAIDSGIQLANKSVENQLIRPDDSWLVYFYMRQQQLESIERMMAIISQVYQILPQGALVAELFEHLSEDVKESHYTGRVELLLGRLEEEFRNMELPRSRTEFEVRSAILQLCRELGQFLAIAKKNKPLSMAEK
ncbi:MULTISPECIES: aromatic acid exporter family protein [unclassified Paenibacillus]|uniref:aromatic acid exporter family protein n=1 Tax=unclassified Paenibacillus TaxID=185978 RepID=UPI001C11DE6D|nr:MULTISPECIES: aromatic acid exporter family protein [unclassified Paenibacillus]MBU5443120.1 FUSC family protein [Paenibacillus sp. MSJ-34]CAH0121132.1 hypothetical protein PAE9249_03658 [Paenibacillus sp. CECT 9249]